MTKSAAAWPSKTAPITWICGSDSKRWTRNSRVTAESSTTSTLIFRSAIKNFVLYLCQAADGFEQVALIEIAFNEIGIGANVDAAFPIFTRFQGGHQYHRQLRQFFIRANS